MLTLVTRTYCHLCDEMRTALEPVAIEFGMDVVELDVDADAELEARYGERAPSCCSADYPTRWSCVISGSTGRA